MYATKYLNYYGATNELYAVEYDKRKYDYVGADCEKGAKNEMLGTNV